MAITNYTVRFVRKVAPANYESAEAETVFSGSLEDGENLETEAEKAMARAKHLVLMAVGKAPKVEAVDDDKVVSIDKAKPQAKAEEKAAEEKPAPKKRRGRPPKKKEPEVEAKLQTPSENPDSTADIPDDFPDPKGSTEADDIPDGIPAGPPKPPAKNTDDIPDDGLDGDDIFDEEDIDGLEEEDSLTISDLKMFLSKVSHSGKVSGAKIKELVASFGVGLTNELTPKQRVELKTKIEEMIDG